MVIYVVCVVLAVFAVGFILGSLYEKDRVDIAAHDRWADGFDDGWDEAHRMMPTPCCKPSRLPAVFDHGGEP